MSVSFLLPFLIPFLITILIFVLLLIFWALQKNENTNIISQFWEKFQTVFEESSNNHMWSSQRFAYIFTMFISNLVIWGAILYLIIHTGVFPEIPEGIIFIYGISNGVASFAKVWQKKEERFTAKVSNITEDKKDDNTQN
jgi:hypothetical protein